MAPISGSSRVCSKPQRVRRSWGTHGLRNKVINYFVGWIFAKVCFKVFKEVSACNHDDFETLLYVKLNL